MFVFFFLFFCCFGLEPYLGSNIIPQLSRQLINRQSSCTTNVYKLDAYAGTRI